MPDEKQLSDAIPLLSDKWSGRVRIDQKNLDLSPVTGVNQAWGIHEGDSTLEGETRSGEYQPSHSARNLNGQAGCDKLALARGEAEAFDTVKVVSRVSCPCSLWQQGKFVKALKIELAHQIVSQSHSGSSAQPAQLSSSH